MQTYDCPPTQLWKCSSSHKAGAWSHAEVTLAYRTPMEWTSDPVLQRARLICNESFKELGVELVASLRGPRVAQLSSGADQMTTQLMSDGVLLCAFVFAAGCCFAVDVCCGHASVFRQLFSRCCQHFCGVFLNFMMSLPAQHSYRQSRAGRSDFERYDDRGCAMSFFQLVHTESDTHSSCGDTTIFQPSESGGACFVLNKCSDDPDTSAYMVGLNVPLPTEATEQKNTAT